MSYQKNNFNNNLQKLMGGSDEKRTFKVVELNGKLVDFGRFTLKKKTSSGKPGPGPSAAAKKALSAIAKHLKVKKEKVNVTFMIQEITRGKDQYKIYGPYKGSYRKFSPKEIKEKEIKLKDGTIIRKEYEPKVKLVKGKKGG